MFGLNKFLGNQLVEKTIGNLTTHHTVHIYFDFLAMNQWGGQINTVFLDGYPIGTNPAFFTYTDSFSCEYNPCCGGSPRYMGFEFSESHSSNKIKLGIKASHSSSIAPFAIKNLQIYLVGDCHESCWDCDVSQLDVCTKCPIFAKLNSDNHCQCIEHFLLVTSDYVRCEECDISCKSCNGLTSSDCTSCYGGSNPVYGKCVQASSIIKYFHIIFLVIICFLCRCLQI